MTVQIAFGNRLPMQPPEETNILPLHVCGERIAAGFERRRHRTVNERRAESRDAAYVGTYCKTRSPPMPFAGIVDANGADDGIGNRHHERKGDDRNCRIVDGVAIIVREDVLLGAEHRTPERKILRALPSACNGDRKVRGDEWRRYVRKHVRTRRRRGTSMHRICRIPL